MKMAVPGTLVALLAADLVKISIGIADSAMFLRMIWRPLAQVVRITNATPPTANGNQPPSGTLVRFAAK